MSELAGDARQLSPSAQEALQLRAVAALVAGWTREDVAAVFQVSLKAVDKWWAKWLAGGREALVTQPRGRRLGEHQVLDAVEQQVVRQAVLDHRPCDLGLAGQLWTRAGVGDVIAKLYRVRLSEQGVGKYLRRWSLSFQRPDKRAVEQNAEAVRVRREETWPAIRAKAKAEGGEVLFADQVGIRSDQVTGRTWGAKGCTPIVHRSGNRFSVNAMSAISTTKGPMHFMVFTETFDADVMCRFLDRLAGHFDHKVHLVVNGRSAHRSRKVHTWLADHPDRIKLHFLPSYSPELNPDELVNTDLKRSLPMHSRARDQAQLSAETRRFFHRRQRQPHIVRGYFGGPHVRYILE
ncbi:IS630 family transposase [Streptomyces europaeiscabiei]|uniref:IS630 family transposase n=1 Tax=Streptomyces europaeiscabiei TaxID=146819 RepID=UPI001F203153|nr:IS630 family transposase [Streptomyces europaeiscabiei]